MGYLFRKIIKIMRPSYLSCICLWNEEKLFFGTNKETKFIGNKHII